MIVSTPDVCFGKPRIDGTRIYVALLAECRDVHGYGMAEMLEAYPHITEAQVNEALDYYDAHKDEIDQRTEESRKQLEKYIKDNPDFVIQR